MVAAVWSRPTKEVRTLLSGKYPLIAQNHAFEVKWLNIHGPLLDGTATDLYDDLPWHDTMLRAHALHEDRGGSEDSKSSHPGYGLDALIRDFSAKEWPSKEELGGWDQDGEGLLIYCGYDCLKELDLHEGQDQELRAQTNHLGNDAPARNRSVRSVPTHHHGVSARLEFVAHPGLRFLDRVRERGMPYDSGRAAEVIARLEAQADLAWKQLQQVAKINWNADPQVVRIFAEMGLKASGLRTDTGSHALHKLAWSGIRAKNPDHLWLLDLISGDDYPAGSEKNPKGNQGGYRGALDALSAIRGTLKKDGTPDPRKKYLLQYVDRDGRVRPRLSIVGTATARLSCSSPALHSAYGPVKDCFVAPPGYLFLAFDVSGAEVGWGAHVSGDERLVGFMNSPKGGGAWHSDTMARVGCERTPAKRINFGIFYGIGGSGLHVQLQTLKWGQYTEDDCWRMIREVRAGLPGFVEWENETVKFGREHGYVETCFGWRRRLPALQGVQYGPAFNEAKRQACNTMIQSPASDHVLLRSMDLEREVPEYEITFLRHDEVLGLVREDDLDSVIRKATEVLERPDFYWGRCKVPLRVEAKTGKSWGELA